MGAALAKLKPKGLEGGRPERIGDWGGVMCSESGCGYDQADVAIDSEQRRGDVGQSAAACAGGITLSGRGFSLWMDR